jgi:hypothetical protein
MGVTVNDGGLQWKAGIDLSGLQQNANEAARIINGIQQKADEQARSIDNLARKAAAGLAAYLSFNAATNFINEMVRVRGEFQLLEVAFTTMLRSKARADKLLAEATALAAKTPFTLQEVGDGAKKLLAYGFSAEQVIGTLQTLGDVSAGVGTSIGDLAYLFGTLKAQGRAFTIDIRQFANRGIPIYEELAKVLKVSVEEVNNLIEAGKVGFPQVEKAFQNMTTEGGLFFNLMEESSKTLTGQISNLKDAFSQMLNSLGKDSEGVASFLIKGLTSLVKNFQTVIDIIKVLAVAYGSYRAAIIVTNALTVVSTALNEGLTLSLFLQAKAAKAAELAQKLLNATMLKNPAALVIAGITSIVTALILFRKKANETKTAQELLAKAQESIGDKMAEARAKIQPYVDELKKANLTEQDRLNIYNKLKDIDPQIVAGIDQKKLSYQNLTEGVNKYLDALRSQFKLEANREAIQESIKQEQDLEKKLKGAQKVLEISKRLNSNNKPGVNNANTFAPGTSGVALDIALNNVKDFEEALIGQKKVTQELGETQVKTEAATQKAKLRTIAVIDEEIKAEKEKQSNFSTSSVEYQQFQDRINALEKERKKITGESKADIKAASKLENDRNSILQKRIDTLQKINDLERDAAQTGLTDKEKALDAITEKYDLQIRALKETNAEIEKFNKKNKSNPVALLGKGEVDRLNAAKALEKANLQYREDAANFVSTIKEKQRAFDDYQTALLTGNSLLVEKFQQTYQDDLNGFTNFVDFVQAEIDSLKIVKALGKGNTGTNQAIEELNKVLLDAQKKADEQSQKLQLENFSRMLGDLETFNQKRAQILRKYNELEAILESNKALLSDDELKARKEAIKIAREQDLRALENDITRQSALYRKLNEDIINFTRRQIKERIKELNKILDSGVNLSPKTKEEIRAAIEQLQGVLDSSNDLSIDFGRLGDQLEAIAGIFSDLSNGVEGLNDGLSDTVGVLGEIVSVGASAVNAIAQFASGDIIGSVVSAVKAIVGIFSIGKKARESRKKAEAELAEFQARVLQGEIDINELYRQRQVEQAKLNKLKLQGLRAELEALKGARKQNQDDFNRVLAQLQKESFVSGEKIKKYGGFLGIGRKSKVVEELSSLAGLNFDQLEKLFMEGRLTGKAKELFEALQKLKQEGLDFDQALRDSQREIAEAITGTTAESIASSILEGFKQGKRSASDFAGDFKDLMQNALLQALQFKALEGPLNDFFDQFAAAAGSGDELDSKEIEQLQNLYNSIITNAADQFEQLQNIADLNFSGSEGLGNSLQGAIRGITEQTGELIAGQFGGLRLTALDQLRVAQEGLRVLNNIETNTAKLIPMYDLWRRIELGGIKVN